MRALCVLFLKKKTSDEKIQQVNHKLHKPYLMSKS